MLGVPESNFSAHQPGFLGRFPLDLANPADVAENKILSGRKPFELEISFSPMSLTRDILPETTEAPGCR